MIVVLLALTCSELSLQQRSLFGREGRDEVLLEYADGFEIIEEVPKPVVKHIKEAKFTESVIEDNDYPWSGHGFRGTCTWALLQKETQAIYDNYYNVDVKQDKLYYHPAGLKQFFTVDEEKVKNAKRYKCRVTISPKYYKHAAPIFMPPGEVVTITLPKDAAGKVYVWFNNHMDDVTSDENGNCRFNQRLNRLRFKNLQLRKEVNTIGFPAGAALTFTHGESSAISFEISGVILSPYFQYGVTSDEDWEYMKQNYPGPVSYFNTGNIFAVMPSKFGFKTRINDVMKFWRSAYQISQTSAQDNYPNNPRDGRILNPPEFNFDNWVAYGWAFAMVGANYCQFPIDGIGGFIEWDALQDNCWGNVHEMNHHHQGSWANGQGDEMSNNAINLQIYARSTQASSPRGPKGQNLWSWGKYSHPYLVLDMTTSDGGLPHYADMLHFFGPDKYRDFIRSDQYNTLYNRDDPKLGRRGAQLLRASKIFGFNMRYNFNFHGFDDNALKNNNVESITFQELDKLNLPPFHPITTTYGTGFKIDGKEFRSARPFRIQPVETRLDFIDTMKTRKNKDQFGDFEFQKIEPFEISKNSFKKTDKKGVYILTPNDDPWVIDGCYAHYLDKTTQKTTIIICEFQQQTPYRVRFVRYSKIGAGKTLLEAYNNTNVIQPVEDWNSQYLQCSKITNDQTGWVSVSSAVFHVEEDGEYEFGVFKADDFGALYLSENPLSFDPDDDKDYLLVNVKWTDKLEEVVSSAKQTLTANKKYYIALVIYNPQGGGEGYAVMRKVGEQKFYNVPQRFITKNAVSYDDYWRGQFHPQFFEIPYLNSWDGIDMISSKTGQWKVYSKPRGRVIRNSNSGQGTEDGSISVETALTDQDPTTEYRADWWQGGGQVPIKGANIYKIDMGEKTTFETIKIGGSGNTGWFDMETQFELRLADGDFPLPVDENGTTIHDPNNISLQEGSSILLEYTTMYKTSSPFFHFNRKVSGRYLQLKFLDNKKNWKDGWKGQSSISSVEVGSMIPKSIVLPSTFKKLNYTGDWKKTTDGYYYNGVAKTGTAGAELIYEVPKDHSIFGLIGDLWDGIGSASVYVGDTKVDTIDKTKIGFPDRKKLKLAHRSFKQLIHYTKFEEGQSRVVRVHVDSGEITVAGFLSDCTGDNCFYDPSEDHEIPPVPGGNPHDHGNIDSLDKINSAGKGLSKTGETAIAVVAVILVVAIAITIFIVGAKKGFWCKPPEDSDIMVEKFAI